MSALDNPGVMSHPVAVVICAHSNERWGLLQQAVASVVAEGPREILVVIDRNPDLFAKATKFFVHQSGTTPIRVLAASEPGGLSAARNVGFAATDAAFVAFIDDDAEVLPGWIGHLLGAFTEQAVVAVGGQALPARPERFPSWWPAEYNWVVGCSWVGLPTARTDVRNVLGCCMAFRREALVDASGFDCELGRFGSNAAGCEETELCIRLQQNGSRVVFEPQATVLHHVDDRRLNARYFVRRCWAEGRSKALVRRRLGGAAFGPERRFAVDVLSRSMTTALHATRKREWAGLGRSTALVGGLLTTGIGFLWPAQG